MDTIKEAEMKEKISKKSQKNKKIYRNQALHQKSNERNKHLCTTPRKTLWILKMRKEEFKQMDQSTRKLITIHKALPKKYAIDRLYMSKKKERGRVFACIEDCVDATIQEHEAYSKKSWTKYIIQQKQW